ncbi:MAG: CvpA family protein [Candidatus Limnocylindrales bacterium]
MEVDVALVVLLAAGFLLGVFRGAVRQLIVLGSWLVAFILSVQLRGAIGAWFAARAPQYSRWTPTTPSADRRARSRWTS